MIAFRVRVFWLACELLVLGLAGCAANQGITSTPAAPTVTATTTPEEPVEVQTTATPMGTSAKDSEVVMSGTIATTATTLPYRFCEPETTYFTGHFLLSRPIEPPGRDSSDRTYPYGGTRGGLLDPHHGVEFVNPQGTPVLAAAEGIVVVAGSDDKAIYGPYADFYGKVVVLKHELPGLDQPLYTLYGHLSEIVVMEGAQVKRGQAIGAVGATGWASGYHLHFEVRLGENNYAQTRNPELWLQPDGEDNGQLHGALIGYILDENGQALGDLTIVVDYQPDSGENDRPTLYLSPYAGKTNGDDQWGETFAHANVPAGWYELSFVFGGLYRRTVEVRPGQVAVTAFCLGQ